MASGNSERERTPIWLYCFLNIFVPYKGHHNKPHNKDIEAAAVIHLTMSWVVEKFKDLKPWYALANRILLTM